MGGGGGGGTLVVPIPVPTLFGQPFPNGPQWNPGSLQPQHTVRSLDRALEEAGNSGILSLSGRKLRDFPGSGYDLTDTTQAGDRAGRGRGSGARRRWGQWVSGWLRGCVVRLRWSGRVRGGGETVGGASSECEGQSGEVAAGGWGVWGVGRNAD